MQKAIYWQLEASHMMALLLILPCAEPTPYDRRWSQVKEPWEKTPCVATMALRAGNFADHEIAISSSIQSVQKDQERSNMRTIFSKEENKPSEEWTENTGLGFIISHQLCEYKVKNCVI